MRVTKEQFNNIKDIFNAGSKLTVKQVADGYDISVTTASRIKTAKNYEEFKNARVAEYAKAKNKLEPKYDVKDYHNSIVTTKTTGASAKVVIKPKLSLLDRIVMFFKRSK